MTKDLHHPFLIGDKCYLRGIEENDLCGNYFQWFNDQNVTQFMSNGAFPNSTKKMKHFLEHISSSQNDIVLAIINKENDHHVGNIGIHRINWIYRIGELGIIIGEKSEQNRGIGSEAIQLILNHSFYRLNLNKIFLLTDENNIAAIKSFKKNGFIQEGLLRKDCFRKGKYVNSVYMGCLREDFEKNFPPKSS